MAGAVVDGAVLLLGMLDVAPAGAVAASRLEPYYHCVESVDWEVRESEGWERLETEESRRGRENQAGKDCLEVAGMEVTE